MAPQISIIMPCLNAERHIRDAVTCVLEQTFTDFELLVVDNGSTDHTPEILGFFTDPRIRIFHSARRGVSYARNFGLLHACGKYIAFLDSDDTWSPPFLEKLHESLQSRPDSVLAYCGWQNVGVTGPRGEPFVPPDYEGLNKAETLLEACPWPIHGALTRHATISAAGGFNTELTIAEDYFLWLEVSTAGTIIRVPEVLAQYRHHDGVQATHNQTLAALDTLKAKQLFLHKHPDIADLLGKELVESLTWGKLVEAGNALHWQGDIRSARPIFRKALLAWKGTFFDKLRMLPSLLPHKIHRTILNAKDAFHF